MKFSENWLRELVAIDASRGALIERLTMGGLEVEGVEALGAGLDGVVIGHITEVAAHPNADRLHVCQVDVGADQPLTIVCGAPNARVGLKAPLATLGAHLPGGGVIKRAKLRGVESFGMLCSARELGLAVDASGLMELPVDAPAGEVLTDYLGLPDASIEVSLTPNRGDCLGMWGLAADAAALFDRPVTFSTAVPAVAVASDKRRAIRLAAGDDCPCYLGRVVSEVDAGAPTPVWMAERLRRAGLRSISVIVDVTNYVMLETGQPLHAFDNATLSGAITVRHARTDECLKLLNGNEVILDPGFMVIADDAQALALAGIMGGMASRSGADTREVFLEAAHFTPAAIMGKARKLGLHTDASHRFERGVDPQLPIRALERATALLLELAGGKAGPVCGAEQASDVEPHAPIGLRRARLARVLGERIDDAAVTHMLESLGLDVTVTADGWTVTAPSRRFDLAIEEDLIEEVARIYGYQRVPVRAPSGQLNLAPLPEARRSLAEVAGRLAARDYLEAVNLAFLPAALVETWGMGAKALPLANPLNADLALMRPSLLPGLIEALKRNRSRQATRVRLFETGHVFAASAPDDVALSEHGHLAWVACGSVAAEQWGVPARAVDFHDVRGDLAAMLDTAALGPWSLVGEDVPGWLHPGRAARVVRDGRDIGYLGALHPSLLAKLDLNTDIYVVEMDLDAVCLRNVPQARPVSKFPAVRRDIAIEVPDAVAWAQIEDCVRQTLGELLQGLCVFDVYAGKSLQTAHKSVAIGLILQDESRTLTDADVDRCITGVVGALARGCGATLRG